MRTLGVAAILAALTTSALSADLTPSSIRALVEGQDATAAVQSLDAATWSTLLAHIEAGERGWIDLVPLLVPGTDADATSRLAATLSRALGSNAAGVLNVIATSQFSPDDICGLGKGDVPAIEAAKTIDLALVKVAAVLDPSLIEARNACLSALGDARIATLI